MRREQYKQQAREAVQERREKEMEEDRGKLDAAVRFALLRC
jgi:hypothetical protein